MDVYESDTQRLEAIEEAGFVLAIAGDKPCPLCGASATDQRHTHGMDDITRARDAANQEIDKIRRQQSDLRLTIDQLTTEGLNIERTLETLNSDLNRVEAELVALAPAADASKRRLDEILIVRDRVRHGLDLLERRQQWLARRDELLKLKPASKADRPLARSCQHANV